jgi:hypothetical protein
MAELTAGYFLVKRKSNNARLNRSEADFKNI